MASKDPVVLYQQTHAALVKFNASASMLAQIDAIFLAPDEPPASATTPAYEIAPLAPPNVKPATVDGSTVQADGSVWAYSPAVAPVEGYTPPSSEAGWGPTQVSYGYISPVKTPAIWEWAKANMPPKGPNTDGIDKPMSYETWDANWQANKFGLYKVDMGAIIAAGEMTIALFAQYSQPYTTYVQ